MLGALSAPLVLPAARPVLTRTDGPALNGALAATGRLLGVFSLLVAAGLVRSAALALICPGQLPLRGASAPQAVDGRMRGRRGAGGDPLLAPLRSPTPRARGQLRERELVLVRARGEGLVGLGETASLSLRGGPGVREIAREIESVCWPAISDAGFDPGRIWSALARCRNRGASPQAIAGVDLALHDLAGKASGQPVWRLLGRRRGRARQVQRDADGGQPRAYTGDG